MANYLFRGRASCLGSISRVMLGLFTLWLVVEGTVDAIDLRSWDRKINDDTRFRVLSEFDNDAVLDRETQLVWHRTPDATKRVWGAALSACYGYRVGGRGGWRLPTMEELTSLIDPTRTHPPLPLAHPFNLSNVTGDVWSATTTPHVDPPHAFTQDVIGTGFLGGSQKKFPMNTWCVRGGQGMHGQ
jgi:hypothetical protein